MYFLAIVNKRNIERSKILPAYVLCKCNGTKKTRTGLRVMNMRLGMRRFKWRKVLVSEPYGHDDLVQFLSNYRTREHMHESKWHHRNTMKYFPVGALFWFECDRFGEPSGKAIYIRRVPDPHVSSESMVMRNLALADEEYRKKKSTFRLNDEFIDLEYSNKKAKIPQGMNDLTVYQKKEKRIKHGSK